MVEAISALRRAIPALFYQVEEQQDISPACTFDLVANETGEGWSAATAMMPLSPWRTNTLVITKDLLGAPNFIALEEILSWVPWLEQCQVAVYFCVQPTDVSENNKRFYQLSELLSSSDTTMQAFAWFDKLDVFQPLIDYQELSRCGVARDRVCLANTLPDQVLSNFFYRHRHWWQVAAMKTSFVEFAQQQLDLIVREGKGTLSTWKFKGLLSTCASHSVTLKTIVLREYEKHYFPSVKGDDQLHGFFCLIENCVGAEEFERLHEAYARALITSIKDLRKYCEVIVEIGYDLPLDFIATFFRCDEERDPHDFFAVFYDEECSPEIYAQLADCISHAEDFSLPPIPNNCFIGNMEELEPYFESESELDKTDLIKAFKKHLNYYTFYRGNEAKLKEFIDRWLPVIYPQEAKADQAYLNNIFLFSILIGCVCSKYPKLISRVITTIPKETAMCHRSCNWGFVWKSLGSAEVRLLLLQQISWADLINLEGLWHWLERASDYPDVQAHFIELYTPACIEGVSACDYEETATFLKILKVLKGDVALTMRFLEKSEPFWLPQETVAGTSERAAQADVEARFIRRVVSVLTQHNPSRKAFFKRYLAVDIKRRFPPEAFMAVYPPALLEPFIRRISQADLVRPNALLATLRGCNHRVDLQENIMALVPLYSDLSDSMTLEIFTSLASSDLKKQWLARVDSFSVRQIDFHNFLLALQSCQGDAEVQSKLMKKAVMCFDSEAVSDGTYKLLDILITCADSQVAAILIDQLPNEIIMRMIRSFGGRVKTVLYSKNPEAFCMLLEKFIPSKEKVKEYQVTNILEVCRPDEGMVRRMVDKFLHAGYAASDFTKVLCQCLKFCAPYPSIQADLVRMYLVSLWEGMNDSSEYHKESLIDAVSGNEEALAFLLEETRCFTHSPGVFVRCLRACQGNSALQAKFISRYEMYCSKEPGVDVWPIGTLRIALEACQESPALQRQFFAIFQLKMVYMGVHFGFDVEFCLSSCRHNDILHEQLINFFQEKMLESAQTGDLYFDSYFIPILSALKTNSEAAISHVNKYKQWIVGSNDVSRFLKCLKIKRLAKEVYQYLLDSVLPEVLVDDYDKFKKLLKGLREIGVCCVDFIKRHRLLIENRNIARFSGCPELLLEAAVSDVSLQQELIGMFGSFDFRSEYIVDCLRSLFKAPELQKRLIAMKASLWATMSDADFKACVMSCANADVLATLVRYCQLNRQIIFHREVCQSEVLFWLDVYVQSLGEESAKTAASMVDYFPKESASGFNIISLYLHVASSTYADIIEQIQSNRFTHLRVITYVSDDHASVLDFLAMVEVYCPNVNIVNLPALSVEDSNLLPSDKPWKYSFAEKISSVSSALADARPVEDETDSIDPPAEGLFGQFGAYCSSLWGGLTSTTSSANGSCYDAKLYIGKPSEKKARVKAGRDIHQKMYTKMVGEALNLPSGKRPKRVRTGRWMYEFDANELSCKPFPATEMVEILQPSILAEADIEVLRKKNPAEGVYYKIPHQLMAGRMIRLLGVDPNERLFGISLSDESAISTLSFYRGNDNFFYVCAQSDCVLQLIVQDSAIKQAQRYAKLPADNPIKAVMEGYLQNTNYQSTAVETTPLVTGSIENWLRDLYTSCLGSCTERCLAVLYALDERYPGNNCSLISIDYNHYRLEFSVGEEVIQVDFGGSAVRTLRLDSPDSSALYKAPLDVDAKLSSVNEPADASNVSVPSNVSAFFESAAGTKPISLNRRRQLAHHKMTALLASKTTLTPINVQSEFLAETVAATNEQCILVVNAGEDYDKVINVVLTDLQQTKQVYYCWDTPTYVERRKRYLRLSAKDEDVAPGYDHMHPLDAFIEHASHLAPARCYLIIDWEQFTAKQRLRMNHIFATLKQYSNIHLIGFLKNKPTDPSFIMRHQKRVDISTMALDKCDVDGLPETVVRQENVIDLQAFPDWLGTLFGRIIPDGDKAIWLKSDFVRALEAGVPQRIVLRHLPADSRAQVCHLLDRAKACGEFNYQGYSIAWPLDTIIDVDSDDCCFDQVLSRPILFQPDVMSTQVPASVTVINTVWFDRLLREKTVSEGLYHETPGLIALAEGQSLALFISNNLSIAQWYCLYYQCERYSVDLTLYLGPGVILPGNLPRKIIAAEESVCLDEQAVVPHTLPTVTLTRDSDALLARYDTSGSVVINSEDYTWQALFEQISVTENERFLSFDKHQSAVLQALARGEQVIIKGKFSAFMLQVLQPFMHDAKQAIRDIFELTCCGSLHFIIEEETLSFGIDESGVSPLSFLSPVQYQVDTETPSPVYPECAPVLLQEEPPFVSTDEHVVLPSLAKAQTLSSAFIDRRLNALQTGLNQAGAVILEGDPGVGKSSLVAAFKKLRSDAAFYHGKAGKFPWANDKTACKKYWCCDEANLQREEFTSVSAVKKDVQGAVLTPEALVDLSADHQAIFAMNGVHVGGDRAEPKLFHDNTIPKLLLNDFPPYYIFSELLYPVFEEVLSAPVAAEEQEAFRLYCEKLLIDYYDKRRQGDESITVRKLQEQVMHKYRPRVNPPRLHLVAAAQSPSVVTSHEYVHLPSCQAVRQRFINFIRVRESSLMARQCLSEPSMAWGCNGYLLKGPSGAGKTSLLKDVLQAMGYACLNDESGVIDLSVVADKPFKGYFCLDADLTEAMQRELLIYAAKNHIMVLVDEIDSIANTLEGLINDLLVEGDLVLVGTANGLAFEARDELSGALRSRFSEDFLDLPTAEDLAVLINRRHTETELQSVDVELMAQDLSQEIKSNPLLSLHNILELLSTITSYYTETLPCAFTAESTVTPQEQSSASHFHAPFCQ